MKKGFTLIELLAVIVILAIIAIIATPIILNIINSSKKSATVRSAEYYIDAVEQAIVRKNLTTDEEFNPTTCEIQGNGNLDCSGTILTVEVEGEYPTEGTITLSNGKITNVENLKFSGGVVSTDEKGNLVLGTVQVACVLSNDADSSGTITLSDEVTCGTETFYVMENDGSNVTMLAKYNLDLTTNIQNESADFISFPKFWSDSLSSNTFVYESHIENGEEKNPIYPHVNAYENYLKENGLKNIQATLMSYEQAINLGCSDSSMSCSNAPSWVYSVGYWTGFTTAGSAYISTIFTSGGFMGSGGTVTVDKTGIRPVIIVPKSQIS